MICVFSDRVSKFQHFWLSGKVSVIEIIKSTNIEHGPAPHLFTMNTRWLSGHVFQQKDTIHPLGKTA